jgi:ATP-dependent RNA helicase DeaD
MSDATNAILSDSSWDEFELGDALREALRGRGYERPTHIQARSLPVSLAGKDVLARSKTGTGKTVAFCLPMLAASPEPSEMAGVGGLILAPTRELAIQGAEELEALGASQGHRVVRVYGGVGYGDQKRGLAEGATFVVGTPGRILDHLKQGTLRLDKVRVAVLDEADEMLSMGFFEEVTSILDRLPSDRQILLFSATVEQRIRDLAGRYLSEPEDIFMSTDVELNPDVDHVVFETVDTYPKPRQLMTILMIEAPRSAIIFCNTRADTSAVARYLDRQGFDAEPISSDLSQRDRERVMGRIKRAELDFLVATDIAARGIDISDLSHVINYNMPEDPAVYLHRTGRTGRVGRRGVAISLQSGTDLGTRRVLEATYGVAFDERELPDREAADALAAERLLARLRKSAGTTAFESYLPTVPTLLEQSDRDVLLATALRGFFVWQHREERVKEVAAEEDSTANDGERAADDRRPRRGQGRGRGDRSRNRSPGPRSENRGGDAKRRRRRKPRRKD